MEKKTGCDWSGTEKKGGVHLPGNTQKGEVVKKLAGDLFFCLTIVFGREICLPMPVEEEEEPYLKRST